MKNIVFFIVIFFIKLEVIYSQDEIVVLVSSTNTIYTQGITGFESSFYKKSKIIYLSEILQKSEEGIEFFREYESKNLPFLVTFGLEATQLASQHLKHTPIIHSFVQSSRIFYKEDNKMCGVDFRIPIKEYYNVLKDLKPQASKVVTFYSTNVGEYSAKANLYEDVFYGIYSIPINVSSSEEFQKNLDNLQEDIDGFLMVADPIYDRKNFEILSSYCKRKGIVLMTSYTALVDIGASFAITANYASIGEQTARFALNVLDGKINCNKGPLILPTGQILYFNEAYTLASGFSLSENFKKRVEEDELISFGLELYYKKLYKSSKDAFEKVLEKNPSHELAKTYLSQLKYRLTKEETDKFSKIADEYLQKKQYRLAAEYYSKVLKLNPDLKDIREKLDKTIQLESEEKRKEGNLAYLKNDPFLAAKKYLEAIKILSSNINAKNDLETLRRQEKPNLEKYFKRALEYYNIRKYEYSTIEFENLLLLNPNDEKAQEYLRLSKLKKEAMERLKKCRESTETGCELLK